MTAEGVARTLAKMIRWGRWERNVLVLCEGCLDGNGRLRFNQNWVHLNLEPQLPELDARITWLREKWAHTKKIAMPVPTPQQYEGHFLPQGSASYGTKKI